MRLRPPGCALNAGGTDAEPTLAAEITTAPCAAPVHRSLRCRIKPYLGSRAAPAAPLARRQRRAQPLGEARPAHAGPHMLAPIEQPRSLVRQHRPGRPPAFLVPGLSSARAPRQGR